MVRDQRKRDKGSVRVFSLAGIRKKEYSLLMEKNDLIILNDLIYHVYDSAPVRDREEMLLNGLVRALSCAYGSILHSGSVQNGAPVFSDPVCVPESFLPAEEAYLRISQDDHMLWSSMAGHENVARESEWLTPAKRRQTRIYTVCYEPFHVYDTLQTNLFDGARLLGTLSLYRTRQQGEFSDEDVFFMHLLSSHLVRLLKEREKRQNPSMAITRERIDKLCRAHDLTPRESQILQLLLTGKEDELVARELSISEGTLRKHVQHIYRKLGIRARRQLLPLLTGDESPDEN
ncbi:MAG TPA: hypothetical protein DGX96_09165 [Lachnospiraceae bacterium]|jgi:DNA-binding CsgD family transcriptional regulator|nr:hypothetical protein [Lachnospiraceae bacterium]